MLPEEAALEIVRVWLETPFEGGRHLRRVQLLDLENSRTGTYMNAKKE